MMKPYIPILTDLEIEQEKNIELEKEIEQLKEDNTRIHKHNVEMMYEIKLLKEQG